MNKKDQTVHTQNNEKKVNSISRYKELIVGLIFFSFMIVMSYLIYNVAINWIERSDKKITEVVIEGDNAYTVDEHIKQLLIKKNLLSSYFKLDVNLVKQILLELPWIESVVVKKHFPSTLILEIREYKPEYRWQDAFYLDKAGNLFTIPDERIKKSITLPQLYGPEGKMKSVLNDFQSFESIAERSKKEDVHYNLVIGIEDGRNAWQILVEYCFKSKCTEFNQVMLELGNQKVAERFTRFIKNFKLISQQIDKSQRVTNIDLRNDNGIIVRKSPSGITNEDN